MTVGFRYNDLESVDALFAAVSRADRLPGARARRRPGAGARASSRAFATAADAEGALLVFDEMITGFRWHLGGAQTLYGVTPDLSTFGKAMANGFALSALVGSRTLMERGGLRHDAERVFLLSTTHGAETHALAAGDRDDEDLRAGGRRRGPPPPGRAAEVRHREPKRSGRASPTTSSVMGRDCNLVYAARDAEGKPSQAFRTLVLQETLKRGVLMPSLVVSFSHGDEDIDRTIEAVGEALAVYRQALDGGIERFLEGRPVQPVFRPAELTTTAEPMLRLELPRRTKGPLQVLCLGAHSDDIEIGCGGTLLRPASSGAARSRCAGSSSAGTPSGRRKRGPARARFSAGHAPRIETKRFRDGFFPAQTARLKEEFERLKRRVRPDLIFCPWRGDAHQDHRLARRARLEHVPRSPDPGVRDPQVRRGPPFAERLRAAGRGDLPDARSSTSWAPSPLRPATSGSTPRPSGRSCGCAGMESNSPSRFGEGFYCRKLLL